VNGFVLFVLLDITRNNSPKGRIDMQEKAGFWSGVTQALASLKLTITIFLTLAACSIIGTLMPQGLTPEQVQSHYSPGVAWFINTFGLYDVYRTNWFRFLLLLLTVNLIVCSIQRLPRTLKLLRRKTEETIEPQKLTKFGLSKDFSTRASWDQVQARLPQILEKRFGSFERIKGKEGFSAVAEKGRWSLMMVYVVHLSVLLILFGALLGSILGFKGVMNVTEGDSSAHVMLFQEGGSIALPFEVRCDKFEVTYYDTGVPKEFRSDLVIVENGQEVLTRSIRVNDPLTYNGITFYQSSYGNFLRKADIEFRNLDSGQVHKLTVPFRETITLPGTSDQVQIVEYRQNLGQFGPALGIVVAKPGRESNGSWVLVNMPDFHGNRIENYQIKVNEVDQAQYTGLQVKQDPGVWFVYVGFIAMLLGTGITYYTSHRKIWAWAAPVAGKHASTRIVIAGRTSKNSIAFEKEFNELYGQLKDEFKPEEKRKKI
jgi:cytochrome c biogenesis protein